MAGFALGARSRSRLIGVHADLVRVVECAIGLAVRDFTVVEGMRTMTRQKQLVAAGASWTLRSRHLTGHAVDLAPLLGGKVSWDWSLYYGLAEAMRAAAHECDVPITWGGTWKSLLGTDPITAKTLHRTKPDGPHFELDRRAYPA
jgi:peptidoglycan L-alanyl-D-glutamate endopeptidase CwlK